MRVLYSLIHKECLLPVAIVLLATACGSLGTGDGDDGPLTEGIIVYDLTYPQFTEDNIFTSMFPREMSFKFKGSYTKSELKTGMSVFSTSLIADEHSRRLTHLVRIAGKYSGVEMDSAQVIAEYGRMPDGMSIRFTDKTKEIAGYLCNHAELVNANSPGQVIDFYYTTEISIPEPNWCTPYHEVKGVLMEATMNKFNIDMRMVAKSVTPAKFDSAEFTITHAFKAITVEEMADIFQSF